jgi:hypothetical protein
MWGYCVTGLDRELRRIRTVKHMSACNVPSRYRTKTLANIGISAVKYRRPSRALAMHTESDWIATLTTRHNFHPQTTEPAGLVPPQAGGAPSPTTPGIAWGGDTELLSLDHWNAIIDLNIRGVVHGSRRGLSPDGPEGQRYIVNTVSMAALTAVGQMTSMR